MTVPDAAPLAGPAATTGPGAISGTALRWRSGWIALGVSTLARAGLAVLASLLAWSVAPDLLGWHTTVVMSGSMEPRLQPGDVVVSRPVPTDQLRLGQVLLVDDPDHPGRLRMHRLAAMHPDGTLTLRGDANAANDSTPVARTAVHGVASLHLPYLGLPEYWLSIHDYRDLALLLAGLGAVIGAALGYRAPDSHGADLNGDDSNAMESAQTESAVPSPALAIRSRRVSRRVALVTLLIVTLAIAALVTAATAGTAGSRFTVATADAGNVWSASQYFTCANAEVGDGARFAWPLSETGGATATDITSNALNGAYSATGVTYGAAGPCNGKTGVTLNGTTGSVSLSANASAIPDLTFEIWFKASGTHGGTLESLTTTTGSTNTTSMALAMTSSGTLTLAIAATGTKTVSTSAAFNDNKWHLAVGVIGASGMALYVDNRAPVTSTAVTTAATASGTPRVGYGNHASLGAGSSDYFQGSVAYAAVYKLALTATQVVNHYAAS